MNITRAIEEVSKRGQNLGFRRAIRIATAFFGPPRISGSHHIFDTPWGDEPIVNLTRSKGGTLKRYQVRSLLAALKKLQEDL